MGRDMKSDRPRLRKCCRREEGSKARYIDFMEGQTLSSILDMFMTHFRVYSWYGGLKGFGVVHYDGPGVRKIIMGNHVIDGQIVSLKQTLFVGGIPETVNQNMFRRFFLGFGKIVKCELVREIVGEHESLGGFIIFDEEGGGDLFAKDSMMFAGSLVVLKKVKLISIPRLFGCCYGNCGRSDDRVWLSSHFVGGSVFGSANARVPYSETVPVIDASGREVTYVPRFLRRDEGRSEELIVQVLCPSDKIRCLTGKEGSSVRGTIEINDPIKHISKANAAKVEFDGTHYESDEDNQYEINIKSQENIMSGFDGTDYESDEDNQYVINIKSQENIMFNSPAIRALCCLLAKINDNIKRFVYMRLLLPKKFSGMLQEKRERLEELTKTDIYISECKIPMHAAANEVLVEVHGRYDKVQRALRRIIACVRFDALGGRDDGFNNSESGGAETACSSLGINSLQGRGSGYGSDSSHLSGNNGRPPACRQIKISAKYITKVLGEDRRKINSIRAKSGARIKIKKSGSKWIAQIYGRKERVKEAEFLIKEIILGV